MGFMEDINKMELSEDVKAQLIAAHRGEVEPLSREARRTEVENDVAMLADAGFDQIPGALAYYRRVQLSDDGQPGTVLLADDELGLSGDDATGARSREDASTAEVLKHFAELIVTAGDKDHKVKLMLSDQAIAADNHDRPDDGEDDGEKKSDKHRESLSRVTGREIKRSKTRYR